MTLKRLIAKTSQINEMIYHGEVLTNSGLHVLFSAKSNIINGVKTFSLISINDIEGNIINNKDVELEILRGF